MSERLQGLTPGVRVGRLYREGTASVYVTRRGSFIFKAAPAEPMTASDIGRWLLVTGDLRVRFELPEDHGSCCQCP